MVLDIVIWHVNSSNLELEGQGLEAHQIISQLNSQTYKKVINHDQWDLSQGYRAGWTLRDSLQQQAKEKSHRIIITRCQRIV